MSVLSCSSPRSLSPLPPLGSVFAVEIQAKSTYVTLDIPARFDEFVSCAYEAVFEPERWRDAIGALAAMVDAPRAAFIEIDVPLKAVWRQVAFGMDDATCGVYAQRCIAIGARSAGGIARQQSHWRSAVDERPHPFGAVHGDSAAAGEGKRIGDGETLMTWTAAAADRAGAVMLVRDASQPRFGARERELLERTLPHIDRAVRLARRLSSISTNMQVSKAMLDGETEPVACVGRDGRIFMANAAFDGVLAAGTTLSVKAGRLNAIAPGVKKALEAAIREACDLAAGTLGVPTANPVVTLQQRGHLPLVMSVAPLSQVNGASASTPPSAMLRISDPMAPPADSLLKRGFGFTDAETRLARGLFQGESLAELAARLGISHNTVKSQMKSVFVKTGVSSRADLFALLRTLPR
jgi:DNA-binding CsgD family transcriptional regulator